VEHALGMAANLQRIPIAKMRQIPPGGRGRRMVHDDITAIVVWLNRD